MAFGSGTSTKGNTSTGNNNIDSLIANRSWASNTVTFSFTSGISDYESGYPNRSTHSSSFESLNATQRTIARDWMEMYESVSGLNLVELTGTSDRDATIRMAESNDPGTAYAYLPGSSVQAGDVWFNRTSYNNPVIGNYAYHTFGHEIGHALGLEHGHEANGIRNVAMNANRDSMEFSIMTYRSYEGDPLSSGYSNESYGYAQSLMMYDIAAIQQMYGANFNTNSSNTTYTFSTTTGEMFVNGVGEGTPGANRIFRTVWDGNGVDTYSFTNYTTNLSINLAPGAWSDLNVGGNAQRAYLGDSHYARGHVFNALQYNGDSRSLIENAYGGTGNDQIYGNAANNYLLGNSGNDSLYGYDGNDTLSGGDGNDYLDTGNGNDYAYGDGGDDSVDAGSGNDIIYGGSGNDNLNGSTGNDSLYGQSGNDTLIGGSGDDYLVGGGYSYNSNEQDTLTSGDLNDSDRFVLGNSSGSFYRDGDTPGWNAYATITDFDEYNYAGDVSDKLVLYGSSSNYSVFTSSGNSYLYYKPTASSQDLVAVIDTVGGTAIDLSEDAIFV